jgi:hypothetical protein
MCVRGGGLGPFRFRLHVVVVDEVARVIRYVDLFSFFDVSKSPEIYAYLSVAGLNSRHVSGLDDDEFRVGRLFAPFVIGELCHAISLLRVSEAVQSTSFFVHERFEVGSVVLGEEGLVESVQVYYHTCIWCDGFEFLIVVACKEAPGVGACYARFVL